MSSTHHRRERIRLRRAVNLRARHWHSRRRLGRRRASFVDTHLEGIVSEAYLITAQTARDAAALLKEQTIVEDATPEELRRRHRPRWLGNVTIS